MYHLVPTETEGIFNLLSDSFRFGIWKIDFVENWNHWQVLVIGEEEVCDLKISNAIVQVYRLSLDSLGSINNEKNTTKCR